MVARVIIAIVSTIKIELIRKQWNGSLESQNILVSLMISKK